MCDWMAQVLALPDFYMFNSASGKQKQNKGGGVIQGSLSESTFVTMLSAKRIAIEKIRRAILRTAEYRTKEEERHQEQRNAKLKQGFLNLLKDVIKVADQIQENNKFLNRNQLKDDTARLINSFLNKKDKTQETVNSKLNSTANGVIGSTESPRLIETTDTANLNGKISKWNLNANLRGNDKSNERHDKPNERHDNKHHKDNEDEENNKNKLLNTSLDDPTKLADRLPDNRNETILDLHLQYLILTDKSFSVETGK